MAWTSLHAAGIVPSQIADDVFWSLVQDWSEPGGTFEAENWISNETGIQAVIPRLEELRGPGGAYIGVGPEQNFTFIAALRPRVAFVVDIRQQNTVQHLMYKALFEMSETRAEFLSRLFSRVRPTGLTRRSRVVELFDAYGNAPRDQRVFDDTLSRIKAVLIDEHGFTLPSEDIRELERLLKVFAEFGPAITYGSRAAGTSEPASRVPPMPSYAELMAAADGHGVQRSYLASEERYLVVRGLQQRNLIVPLTGDFAGPKTLRAVGRYLKDHDTTVAAFYLSNVEGYLFRQTVNVNGGWKNFYENVASLPLDGSSLFIRSWSGGGPVPPGGMPYSMLASIQEVVAAVKDGRLQTGSDARTIGVLP